MISLTGVSHLQFCSVLLIPGRFCSHFFTSFLGLRCCNAIEKKGSGLFSLFPIVNRFWYHCLHSEIGLVCLQHSDPFHHSWQFGRRRCLGRKRCCLLADYLKWKPAFASGLWSGRKCTLWGASAVYLLELGEDPCETQWIMRMDKLEKHDDDAFLHSVIICHRFQSHSYEENPWPLFVFSRRIGTGGQMLKDKVPRSLAPLDSFQKYFPQVSRSYFKPQFGHSLSCTNRLRNFWADNLYDCMHEFSILMRKNGKFWS